MNARSCLAERLSSLGAGSILLLLGALVALFGLVTLPFFGFMVAAPLLVSAVFLIVASWKAECPLP